MIRRLQIALLAAIVFTPGYGLAAQQPAREIQGKLTVENGKPSILRYQGKDIPLTSARKSVADTFRDQRLSGKEMKLIGEFHDDGSFEIDDFFVVHGKGL